MITRIGFWIACLSLLLASSYSAWAMQPCPPKPQRLANAKIIVEARAKSVFMGQAGLIAEGRKIGIFKAELDVIRVIKGKFEDKEVTVYDSAYDAALGPLRSLMIMAALYGESPEENSFEIEISKQDWPSEDLSAYTIGSCGYSKFPVEFDEEASRRPDEQLRVP